MRTAKPFLQIRFAGLALDLIHTQAMTLAVLPKSGRPEGET